MTKPIVANANLPQNPDSSSSSSSTPQQLNLPQNQKPSSLAPTNRLRRLRPPQPSITQLERAVGAGSFRDGEPELKYALLPLLSFFIYLTVTSLELVLTVTSLLQLV